MVSTRYVPLPGSTIVAPAGATRVAAAPSNETMEISVYLQPRDGGAVNVTPTGNPRADLSSQRAILHAPDIDLLTAFAQQTGLTVVSVEPARRLIKLSGTVAQMEAAFKTQLHHYQSGGRHFRARTGTLCLPDDVVPVVESVLGLDTRPAAQPRFQKSANAASANSYPPNQVVAFYNFPTSVTGAGQCIALIELGGGFITSDTDSSFGAMGLTPPSVLAVSVDGGANTPTPDDGSDAEVALDIQVAGGVAPGATIAVYFAPNTTAGFVDAVTQAAHDATNKPSVISISWGSAESNWTAQTLQSMTSAFQDAASLGISVFVAAGDNLATDGVTDGAAHVDFPASSPWAIGCGGTAITVSGTAITDEQVWNDGTSGTGGGISDNFTVPSFQENAHLPPSVNAGRTGRGVPDVAGDASPETGYSIVVRGQQEVVGGTSAVAPLWAGLAALINQQAAKPIGFFLPTLYGESVAMRDITKGSNIPSGSTIGYNAGPGWDACTGLGVPDGAALLAAFAGTATTSD